MAEPNTATVEAPAAPSAGQDAGLDRAIAAMESRLFTADTPASTEQAPGSAAPATTPDQAATTEQPTPTQDVLEPGGSDDIDEGSDQPAEQGKAKPGRAKRLAEQLTQAEERARAVEQALQQRDQQQQDALRQFIDLVLPDPQFEALRVQAEGGDWEAKQKLDLARTWRRMVAPIADVAHHAAKQQFDQALADLRTLDGMDGDGHQKLIAATTPGEKVKLAWELGRKAADQTHKERIAALEAEVQALKTNRAANGAQPANGGAPGGSATGLAGLVGRDGMLTDDALNLTPAEIKARFGRVA